MGGPEGANPLSGRGDPGPEGVSGQHNTRPEWTQKTMDLVRNKGGGVKRVKLMSKQEYEKSMVQDQGPGKRQKTEDDNDSMTPLSVDNDSGDKSERKIQEETTRQTRRETDPVEDKQTEERQETETRQE